ncbi:unnamed protein product [Paramecium pentaurelia]|uniref:Uncharacterized protein n=1 Tax=Paramecium pentaurelia TaxID=43138 RepID=A0A8S1X0I1_9CILI|nr:unnamed protein product [Paramecium pentaurelia]
MLLIQLYLNIQVSIIEQILVGIYFASTATDSITLLYFIQNFFSFSSVLLQTFSNSSIYQISFQNKSIILQFVHILMRKIKFILIIIQQLKYQQKQINITKFNVSQSQSYVELFRKYISIEGQVQKFTMNKKVKLEQLYIDQLYQLFLLNQQFNYL